MTALSAIVIALAMIAAGGGLLIDDLYRDNLFVRAAWHGADIVTLLVTVPILATAMALAARGSVAARPLWLGRHAAATIATIRSLRGRQVGAGNCRRRAMRPGVPPRRTRPEWRNRARF